MITHTTDLICEVCKLEVAIGVAASPIGPMSIAYCRTCLHVGAQPLWTLETMDDCDQRPRFYRFLVFYKGNYFPYGDVVVKMTEKTTEVSR